MTLLAHGKGGKEMAVKVTPALWREVQAYVAKWRITGFLFTALSRNPSLNSPARHMSTSAVWQLFKKYCRRAGLNAEQLSPHSARATAITLALDGGASVRQVQSFARHADANTTLRYDRHRQNLDDNAADYIRLKLAGE
jgi:integrase